MTNFVKKLSSLFSRDITIESKKRQLLRTACLAWFSTLLFISIKTVINNQPGIHINLMVNAGISVFIAFIFFLDIKGKSKLANTLLPVALLVSLIITSFFIFPGKNNELFLILVGPVSVFFARQRTLENILFSIAFGAFLFLPKLLGIDSEIHQLFHFKVFFVVMFILVKDVDSVNRKTEQILNKQKQQAEKDKELIEAQKMELEELNSFKNKFFVNVSHELRTPITLIDGFASHIVRNKEEDSIPHVEKILDQSSKMKVVVDQILDLSKMKLNMFKLNLTQVNLAEILQKIHASFLPLFTQKKISFSLNIPYSIDINVDPIYIERAINNIVLNSLKYTEHGEVSLAVEEKNDGLLLLVSDTGIGIKPTDIDKLSQEFYQVDNDINHAGGSGIGLSFAKNIVELHNGTLEIESEWGKGTQISLNMGVEYSIEEKPQEISPVIINKESINSNQLEANEKPTILVVEDNKEMRSYLALLLSKNYHILEAGNGLEGLPILSANKVDFILTDYMMPKMNGGEFIKRIRKEGYETPVIVLTARTDVGTKLDTLRMGIDDYLHKPFNSDELLIKIQNRLSNFKEKNTSEEKTTTLTSSAFIRDLSKYIDDNCHKYSFKLEDICLHLGLSESSLFRKVKSETGLSPIALIKEVRFLKARRLIERREVNSVKELVSSIGIKNKTYFDKQYFERFGSHLKDLID